MSRVSVGAARIVLAALVIAFVATRVPWTDTVQMDGHDGVLEGVINGDWRGEEIEFQALRAEEVPKTWDAPWADHLRGGEAVTFSDSSDVQVDPGLVTAIGGLKASAVLGVLLAVLGGLLCGVARWWGVLRACGVPTPYWTVMRLTLLGMFFNLVVPGLTGGDVVKAGLAARDHPGQKGAAIMSVGLDRLIGLWTLLWIAAGTSWVLRSELSQLVVPLFGACLLSTLGLIALGVPRVRDALGAQRFLAMVPKKLAGMVESLRAVADKPAQLLIAVAWSAGNHVCIGGAIYAVSRGIGDDTSFVGCLAATVVASAVSAIPLAPGGWGVGEAAYAAMFGLLGSGQGVGFAVSVTYRLCQTGVSLLCGAALWRRGGTEWRGASQEAFTEDG